MHPRTLELLRFLDDQRADLRDAFGSVPASLRSRAPGPARWSTAGVIEHLAIVENHLARRLRDAISDARTAKVATEQETAPVLPTLDLEPLFDRTTRLDASESTWPTGQDADSAWAALEEAGATIRAALKSGDGLALSTQYLPHPVFGKLNLYYFVAFVGAHEARHANQIREIRSQISK
jgi:hypothetical protein